MQLKNNRGELVKYFERQGYGFIWYENREVYVHVSNYLSGFTPEVNQLVAFDFGLFTKDPSRPPQAVNVRVVKEASAVKAEREIVRQLQEELKKADADKSLVVDASKGGQ